MPLTTLLFHDVLLVADQRARHVLEAGEHLQPDLVQHRQLDRAGLQHLGAQRCQLQHLLVGNAVDLARPALDAGVGGVDAVDVGVDVAALGAKRRGQRHGRSVRAAAAERCDAPVGPEPLETRDDRVQPLGELAVEIGRVDVEDPRRAMRAGRLDRHLPALPRARGHVDLLERERQQPGGHLLAAGDDRVVFARVIEAAAMRAGGRGGLANPADKLVRRARHRRDDDGDLVAPLDLALDRRGGAADSIEVGERCPAEFHHQARHCLPSPARARRCRAPPVGGRYIALVASPQANGGAGPTNSADREK